MATDSKQLHVYRRKTASIFAFFSVFRCINDEPSKTRPAKSLAGHGLAQIARHEQH